MTRHRYGFEGITPGGAIIKSAVTSDPGSVQAVAVSAGSGSITADTLHAHTGTIAAKVAGAGNAIIRFACPAESTQQAWSWYCYADALVAGTIFQAMTTANANITGASLVLTSDRKINAAGTVSAAAVTLAQINRIEVTVNTVTGAIACNVFDADSTTPYLTVSGTGGSMASANIGRFDLGAISGSNTIWLDDVQVEDGTTTPIGPYVPTTTLGTPSPTISSQTNPSSVGGNNGSVTVAWAAIPNAASYDAYVAAGTSPAQGDYTLVQAGVTSPFTYTGLTAGARTYGIEAKA